MAWYTPLNTGGAASLTVGARLDGENPAEVHHDDTHCDSIALGAFPG